MSPEQNPISDPLVEEVRETRRRLVEEHGGLRGWVDHLEQAQEHVPRQRLLRRGDAIRQGAGSDEDS